MDQKGGFSDFKILFLTLILFTISFFVYSAFISVASLDYANSAIIAYGGSEGNDNGTKGGEVETINVTVVVTADATGDNVTAFNVTLPASNYTFLYFVGAEGVEEIESGDSVPNATHPLGNVTFFPGGSTTNWGCYNVSATQITCNTSEVVGTTPGDALGGGENTTIILTFNVSATTDRSEMTSNILLSTANDTDFGSVNTTTLNLTIDGIPPRLIDINITDGNTTLRNATSLGTTATTFNISRYSSYLSNATNLTIYMTFQEQGIADVHLYYNCTSNNAQNVTSLDSLGHFFVPSGTTNYSFKGVQGLGTTGVEIGTETLAFTGTIDSTCSGVNGNTDASFLLVVNDTYGNSREINYTGGTPFAFAIQGNHDGRPTFYNANVTDLTNTLSGDVALDGNGDYLNTGNHTFNIELSGAGVNTTDILFVYNLSNNIVVGANAFDASSHIVKVPILNNISSLRNSSRPGVVISHVNFLPGANKSTNVTFAWLANSTVGGRDANYTVIAGPYSYVIDGGAPAASLTEPTDTSIDVRSTIKYTCTGTDTESGVSTYVTKITKPSGDTVTKSESVAATEVSFTGDDTNEAGTYSIDCTLTDAVGNENTVSSSFSALFTTGSSGGSGGGGGGGGSSGTAETVSFDVDFSEATTSEASLQVAEGSTRTFSFDGATTHTLKVDSVSDTSATITIASDPQTFEMNVGETVGVDINNDGLDDIEVTLKDIDHNGVVDLSIVKVEEGAAIVAEEEIAAAAEETTTGTVDEVAPTPTEAKGYGTTITIIVILVIVVLLVVYYFMQKK